MTNPEVALSMLGLLIFAILTGFPIAFTLMGLGVLFGFYAYYDPARADGFMDNRVFDLLVNQTYSVMSNDVLMAIPLFLFMGYIIERANLVDRLFLTLAVAGRKLPGAMALAALATCTLFATATGIVGAVVTLMGLLALPVMLKARYDPGLASGVICAGGCLGILIPPSIMLIVYSATSGIPVLPLYAAALLPGLMLAGLYMIYVFVRALINPELAPPPRPEDIPDASPKAIARMLLTSFAPLAALIFCVLGSILFGLATPSEAAAMGVIGGLVLGIGYRIAAIRSGTLSPPWAGSVETAQDAIFFAIGFSGLTVLALVALYGLASAASRAAGLEIPAEPGLFVIPGSLFGAVAVLALATFFLGPRLPLLGALMPERPELRRIFVFAGQGAAIGLIAGAIYWLAFGPLDLGLSFAYHTLNPFGPEIGMMVGLAGYAAWRVADQERLRESIVLTVRTSAMVCWLFVGSGIFASVFAYLGGVELIKEVVIGLDLSPIMFLLLAQAIIFLLGWPLEWSEIIIIFVPIFLPLLAIFQIDPLLFGILIALNLQTSFLTPPVAMSAFYLKGVAPDVALSDIFRGSMPFLFIVFFAMFLVYLFPAIALWLPEAVYGK